MRRTRRIDLLQKSLTPHPQPLPALREGRQSVALAGWGSFLFLIYARGLITMPNAQS